MSSENGCIGVFVRVWRQDEDEDGGRGRAEGTTNGCNDGFFVVDWVRGFERAVYAIDERVGNVQADGIVRSKIRSIDAVGTAK